jgi:hypothetical protein
MLTTGAHGAAATDDLLRRVEAILLEGVSKRKTA